MHRQTTITCNVCSAAGNKSIRYDFHWQVFRKIVRNLKSWGALRNVICTQYTYTACWFKLGQSPQRSPQEPIRIDENRNAELVSILSAGMLRGPLCRWCGNWRTYTRVFSITFGRENFLNVERRRNTSCMKKPEWVIVIPSVPHQFCSFFRKELNRSHWSSYFKE